MEYGVDVRHLNNGGSFRNDRYIVWGKIYLGLGPPTPGWLYYNKR